MKGLSILAILLLHICSTGYNNASSHPSTLLVEATKIRETPSTTKNNNVFSKKKNNKLLHPQTKSDKRRVFSWVSIVVLVNILFFFRSFAVSTMLVYSWMLCKICFEIRYQLMALSIILCVIMECIILTMNYTNIMQNFRHRFLIHWWVPNSCWCLTVIFAFSAWSNIISYVLCSTAFRESHDRQLLLLSIFHF